MALKINKALNQKVYKYIPLIERGEDKPFTVYIRRLTPKEYASIEDKTIKINKDETLSFTTGTFNWEVCKKGIVNWENLLDENNKEIKIIKDDTGVSDDSLNLLPLDIITEIANVILGITKDPDNAHLYLGDIDEETESK
jgi:hypothetical protein